MRAMFEYSTDLFDSTTIARMAEHFVILLEGIVADPDRQVTELPLMSPAERQRMLVEWNTVPAGYSPHVCLHHLVEAQVDRTPDTVAVVCPAVAETRDAQPAHSSVLTYAELDRRANQLAQYLRRLGIGPDSIVGVCAERSLELVIGALGVLKAGAAYMPLDPQHPPHRLAFMLSDARVRVVLAQQAYHALLPSDATIVALDGSDYVREPATRPDVRVTPDNLAYVIYTSGSTGEPKGSMIEHRAISNNLLWMQRDWPLGTDDRLLQKTPFTFDVSVKEIFWPLLAGAQLVLAQPGGHRDPEYLRMLMNQESITVTHFVPSMLQLFLAGPVGAAAHALRLVMCGAETLPVSLQERFQTLLPADLLHLYGPTEAAIAVTGWMCERGTWRERVPLGRPMPHVQLYVLDAALQPVPIGVPGELYIGGLALARGYLHRPDTTAEHFIPDPFGSVPGGRLYRTGDLARYQPDGNLEYLGRLDHQVKLRGLRIELGEIEIVLRRHQAVRDAVVIMSSERTAVAGAAVSPQRIVGYVVLAAQQALTGQDLRQYLASQLPEYMVPSTVLVLDAMPLNANGKVDRGALPMPPEERPELANAYVAPRTPDEETLASIWRELLGLEQIGVYDSFFDLGGHSLLAAQVVARLRDVLDIELPLRAMFEESTIAGLAVHIERARAERHETRLPELKPVARGAYRQAKRLPSGSTVTRGGSSA